MSLEGKRYSQPERSFIECPEADAYIEELIAVGRKYGVTLSHEDGHGAFLIEGPSEDNERWLRDASLSVESDSIEKPKSRIELMIEKLDEEVEHAEGKGGRDHTGMFYRGMANGLKLAAETIKEYLISKTNQQGDEE